MTPLYDAIINYNKNNKARFHMPGHSGTSFGAFKDNSFDITELPGLDNLLQADGVIKEAEALLAKSFNSKYSLMCTSGSTICMQISMLTVRDQNYDVIALGKMHNSFYNAARVYGVKYNSIDSVDDLIRLLDKSEKQFAVFTTSPNYFGEVREIEVIKKIVSNKNSILIVDEAHGAHFAFSSLLPKNAGSIADISFTSMHKTMPTFGGSAVINCNNDSLYECLLQNRLLCHSTSPSYLAMASMDYAREDFSLNGEEYYSKIKSKIDSFKGQFAGYTILKSADFSRLVLTKKNIDCYDVLNNLHERGFDIEMAYYDKLVLIVTPFNYKDLDEIKTALQEIPCNELKNVEICHKCEKADINNDLKPSFVSIDESIGCIANGEIGIYPPSVPVVSYGEIIDAEAIKILKDNKGHLFGLVNNKVPVLQ